MYECDECDFRTESQEESYEHEMSHEKNPGKRFSDLLNKTGF